MKLKPYLISLGRGGAASFAKKIRVSQSFLSQLASGLSTISPARAVEIETASAGAVSRQDLRPNDYWLIWPDLKPKRGAKKK